MAGAQDVNPGSTSSTWRRNNDRNLAEKKLSRTDSGGIPGRGISYDRIRTDPTDRSSTSVAGTG